ncbi:OprD family outer membrane porin, partial [Sulfurospirillum sp.]|uniref:OprD family outer membrane porin n=1 Tax=Sulfurospirillum sp. TaxID=2053622 RepID=UPI002FDDCAAA
LADAFKNGKVNGTLKAWYWDNDEEGNFYSKASHQSILNLGIELGYVTDTLYGLRFGATYQGSSTPFATDDAKALFNKEESGQGSVLSEAYIGYQIGKTDVKVGRQYISTPLLSGNPTRFFRESFEGISVTNTDLPQTTVFAHYVDKFQGRTSDVLNGVTNSYKAPEFAKQIIVAGAGPTTFEFDGAYSLGAVNKSIPNLTLTAQFAEANDVHMKTPGAFGPYGVGINKTDDISFFYTEANYVLPMSNYKLLFDANYRGSRAGSELDAAHIDGSMLALRVGFAELYGFGGALAYSTVSNGDDMMLGLGNGPLCYTILPIRGPLVFNGYAGTDTYKLSTTYDFSKIGVNGLTTELAYVTAKQDAPSAATISTKASNKLEVDGYSVKFSYAIPALKGLTTDVTYVAFDKDYFVADVKQKTLSTDELWVNVNYKF